jgi:hypothetical protein
VVVQVVDEEGRSEAKSENLKSEQTTKRCDDFPFLSKDPLQRYEDYL